MEEGTKTYPNFDSRLLKVCFRKSAYLGLGTLDPFWTTKFLVSRIKAAEHRHWMQSWQSLRRAIETSELQVPKLVEVFTKIIGFHLLSVSYLKESAKKR